MRRKALLLAALGALALTPKGALAQESPTGTTTLSRFEPTPSGDVFFGVPSPTASGHLDLRAAVLFDYADKPMRLGDLALVSSQGFLRLDASLALWDRLLLSIHMPFAVLQGGEQPAIPGVTLAPPSGPALGDLRFGARARLFGEDRGPFQAALGGYFSVPTGPADMYTGEGSLRGHLHAAMGGTLADVFVWNASGGVVLHGADEPHAIAYGAGVALKLLENRIQIGPELYATTALGPRTVKAGPVTNLTSDSGTSAELLFGAKARPSGGGFVLGFAGGPGFFNAIGTPTFRLVAMVGWAPEAGPRAADSTRVGDRDEDGFRDDIDACPDVKGELTGDPEKDGCPPDDRDGDSIVDLDDACPTQPGPQSSDATKTGCPLDADGDEVADGIDACPNERGPQSQNPAKNGCPPDADDDGIADALDACPKQRGIQANDPKQRGCPDDPDGDGVKWPNDACPAQHGSRDSRPERNGCPKFVEVKNNEVVIGYEIHFIPYGKTKQQAVDPVSNELLTAIRDEIARHPEIELIEIQGHTDDNGDPTFNQWLSEERANAVRRWLIEAGVPAEKLVAKGYGHTAPVGDNRIFDGREQNRRVIFKILKRR